MVSEHVCDLVVTQSHGLGQGRGAPPVPLVHIRLEIMDEGWREGGGRKGRRGEGGREGGGVSNGGSSRVCMYMGV